MAMMVGAEKAESNLLKQASQVIADTWYLNGSHELYIVFGNLALTVLPRR